MVMVVLSVATNDVDVAIPESAPAPQSTKKWSRSDADEFHESAIVVVATRHVPTPMESAHEETASKISGPIESIKNSALAGAETFPEASAE